MDHFSGVKIFSATMQRDRDALGERITGWIDERKRASKEFEVTDCVVSQSSDSEFHCLSLCLFYVEGTR